MASILEGFHCTREFLVNVSKCVEQTEASKRTTNDRQALTLASFLHSSLQCSHTRVTQIVNPVHLRPGYSRVPEIDLRACVSLELVSKVTCDLYISVLTIAMGLSIQIGRSFRVGGGSLAS